MWSGLCRSLQSVGVIYPAIMPLPFQPILPIPIEIVYLPSHVRTLSPPSRLDQSPLPVNYRWHQQEAENMSRLSPSHILEV